MPVCLVFVLVLGGGAKLNNPNPPTRNAGQQHTQHPTHFRITHIISKVGGEEAKLILLPEQLHQTVHIGLVAKRQDQVHLLADAARWFAPPAAFALLQRRMRAAAPP